MKTVIIGFDGLVRAGKTSLITKLSNTLNASIISEYKSYATKYGKEFPSYPPLSYLEAINASKFFIEIEQKRIADLNNLLSENKIILVDRTSLSCLAFDYSANNFTNLGTFSEVEKLWINSQKITPDLNFFMDVNQENLIKRMIKEKDNFPPHIYDKDFNWNMVVFFKQKCDENKNMIRINANQSAEQVEIEVINVILKFIASIS